MEASDPLFTMKIKLRKASERERERNIYIQAEKESAGPRMCVAYQSRPFHDPPLKSHFVKNAFVSHPSLYSTAILFSSGLFYWKFVALVENTHSRVRVGDRFVFNS